MIDKINLSGTTGIYRSRRGLILGVCQGMADARDLSVWCVRAIAIVILFFSGIWPALIVYLLAAVLLQPEPVLPLNDRSDREFYNSYASSRTLAIHRLKRTYDNLERRIRRMEGIVTAREHDWERRLREEP